MRLNSPDSSTIAASDGMSSCVFEGKQVERECPCAGGVVPGPVHHLAIGRAVIGASFVARALFVAMRIGSLL